MFDAHSVLLAGFKSACQQMCVLHPAAYVSIRQQMFVLASRQRVSICGVALLGGVKSA
jgi:hypothetical protein